MLRHMAICCFSSEAGEDHRARSAQIGGDLTSTNCLEIIDESWAEEDICKAGILSKEQCRLAVVAVHKGIRQHAQWIVAAERRRNEQGTTISPPAKSEGIERKERYEAVVADCDKTIQEYSTTGGSNDAMFDSLEIRGDGMVSQHACLCYRCAAAIAACSVCVG